MRFLLDANLSPLIATHLADGGHEAIHVRDLGLRHAADERILGYAQEHGFVIVSQDSDFTNLLVYRNATRPSLILLRNVQEVSAADIARLILANLKQVEEALTDGAVVSVLQDRIRIRRLPIRKGRP